MTLSARDQIERRQSNELTENSQTGEEMSANNPAITLETCMTEERDIQQAGNQPTDTHNKMTTDIAGRNDETRVNENIENDVHSDDEIITIVEFESDKDVAKEETTKETICEGVKSKERYINNAIDDTGLKERSTKLTHHPDSILCGNLSCESVVTKETNHTVKDIMEIFVICEDRGNNCGTLNETRKEEVIQPHLNNAKSVTKKTAKISTSGNFDFEMKSNSDLKHNVIVCETGERDTALSCDETEISEDKIRFDASVWHTDRNADDKTRMDDINKNGATDSLSEGNIKTADKMYACKNEDANFENNQPCQKDQIIVTDKIHDSVHEDKLITTRNYPETKIIICENKESHDSDKTSDPFVNNSNPIQAQRAVDTEPVQELEEGEIEDHIDVIGQNDQNTEVANTKLDDKACLLQSQSGSNSSKLVGEANQKSNIIKTGLNRSQTNKWTSERNTVPSNFKSKEYYDRDARPGRTDNYENHYRNPREIVDYGDKCYIVVDFADEELDGVKEDINTSNEELKTTRTTEPLSEDTRICKIKEGSNLDELLGKRKMTEQKDNRYRASRPHRRHRERRHSSSGRSNDRHKRKHHHKIEQFNKHDGKDFQNRKRRHSKSRSRSPKSKQTRYLNLDFKDGRKHSSDRISVENRTPPVYSPKERALADRGITVFHRPRSSTSAEHNENVSPKRSTRTSTDSQRNTSLYQTPNNSVRGPVGRISEARHNYDDDGRIHYNHNSHASQQNMRETYFEHQIYELDKSRRSFEDNDIDRTQSYRNNRSNDGLLSYGKSTPRDEDKCSLFSKRKRSFGNDRVDIPHQSNTQYIKERSYSPRDSCEFKSMRKQPRLSLSNTKGNSKELSFSYAKHASETTEKEARAGAVLYENDKQVERRHDDYGIKHSQERSMRKQPRLSLSNTKGNSKELSFSYAKHASETTEKEARAGAVLYENDKQVERRYDDYGIKHSQERRSPEQYHKRGNMSIPSPARTEQNDKGNEQENTFNWGRDFESDTSNLSNDEDDEHGKYSHVSDDEIDEKREEQNLIVTKDDLESFSDELRNEVATKIHRALVKRNLKNISPDAVNNIIKNETSCSISFELLDDLMKFIQQYPDKFVVLFVLEKDMISVKTDIGICSIYTNDQRKEHECRDLHICKYYMLSHCPSRNCKFSHDLNAPHNINALFARDLGDLEEASVKSVMQNLDSRNMSTSPFICKFYNNPGGCRTDENCTFLHICLHYINGDCKYGMASCKRSHDFRDTQPRAVLARHGIELDCDDDAKIIGLIKETLHDDKIKLKRDLSHMSSSEKIFNSVKNTNGSTSRSWHLGETNRKTQTSSNGVKTSKIYEREFSRDNIKNISDERDDESDFSVEEEFTKQPDFIPFDNDRGKQKSRINKGVSKTRVNKYNTPL